MRREPKLSPNAGPLAREVHKRATEAGVGQKALAELAGLNETYVRDLYKARVFNPRHEHLAKLAAALGCTIDELISAGMQRVQDADARAHTAEERALLVTWRTKGADGEVMRQAIVETIERVTTELSRQRLEPFTRFRKPSDR